MNEHQTPRRPIALMIAAGVIAALVMAAVFLPPLKNGGSTFSRQAEADFFAIEMKPLSSALEESYRLRRGDAIEVSLTRTGGEVSIAIGQKGQTPIYEGRNPALTSFLVTVPEDGDYIITVTGKEARGSITFRILRTTESARHPTPIISPAF